MASSSPTAARVPEFLCSAASSIFLGRLSPCNSPGAATAGQCCRSRCCRRLCLTAGLMMTALLVPELSLASAWGWPSLAALAPREQGGGRLPGRAASRSA